MDIEQMRQMAEAEREHVDRLQVSIETWQRYLTVLSDAETSLTNAAAHTSAGWTDSAGKLFEAKTTACSAAIKARRDAVVGSGVQNVLSRLMGVVEREYNAVMMAYDAYKAAEKALDVAGMEKALQDAVAALRRMGAEYGKGAQAVQQAMTVPGQSRGGGAAGGGPGGAGPGGHAGPGGAGPSGAAGEASPAAAGDGAGAGAGAEPGAGAGPGAETGPGAGPSLAGAAPPAVAPVKPIGPPPVPAPPSIAPVGSAIPGLGGIGSPGTGLGGIGSAARLGGVGSAGFGNVTPVRASIPGHAVSGQSVPGQIAIPKAVGSAPHPAAVPPAGTPPQLPAAAAPAPAGGQPTGITGVPPMAHGMAGAPGTSGTSPKPGDADKPLRRNTKTPRTVPGVPPELRGRAGKLDNRQAFLFPAATPATREPQDPQLVDEDLWQTDDPGHATVFEAQDR